MWVIWLKGRSFAPGYVFHASRLSAGNHLSTQVLIPPTSVVRAALGRPLRKRSTWPNGVGEDRYRAVASNVEIETSGSDSIRCHGHHKGDATKMKALIEQQSDYYRNRGVAPIT
jgi:hypothetical protein